MGKTINHKYDEFKDDWCNNDKKKSGSKKHQSKNKDKNIVQTLYGKVVW